MGTNFYLKNKVAQFEKGQHVGKRSAAGRYCWKCNVSLCKDGSKGVHTGRSEWHNKCPICGTLPTNERLNSGAAARELGFEKRVPIVRPKDGVSSCSSFAWAMAPHEFDTLRGNVVVEDEYGHMYSVYEFRNILNVQCPLRYYHIIGVDFS